MMTGFLFVILTLNTKDPHDFLRELSQKRAGLLVLKSDLRIENLTPEEKTESKGRLLYVSPDRLVLRVFSENQPDQAHVFLVDGKKLFEFDPSIQQLQIFDLSENPDILAILTAFTNDLTQLENRYHIDLFEPGDVADRAAFGLLLEPRDLSDGNTRLFERIRIYLREADLLPTLIHIINDADSEALMFLDNIHTNVAISEHEDQIAVPRDTKIVENEQRIRTVKEDVEYIPARSLSLRGSSDK